VHHNHTLFGYCTKCAQGGAVQGKRTRTSKPKPV